MYKVFILCLCFAAGVAGAAGTVLYPYAVNPHIVSCGDAECTRDVHAAIDGVELRPVPVLYPPFPRSDIKSDYQLEIVGVRCSYEWEGQAVPTRCAFGVRSEYGPELNSSSCALMKRTGWELDPAANTCVLSRADWVIPVLPATERPVVCLLFASVNTYVSGMVRTPGGDVSPDQLVAAGANGCVVVAKPPVPCEIDLPGEIDHGTVGTNGIQSVTVEGTVQCGFWPRYRMYPSVNETTTLQLGRGVTSTISLDGTRERSVRVTSTLRVNDGAPGVHQGIVIILVRPY